MGTLIADIPGHLYCLVDRRFLVDDPDGAFREWERASWFGLVSVPNRAWGLTVLLESGAVFSPLPPHAIAFREDAPPWTIEQAQTWDCFGTEFGVTRYDQLDNREVRAYVRGAWCPGTYLFTAQHYGDGYSRAPEQAKSFQFAELDNGRLTIVPNNRMLVVDHAFTKPLAEPPERPAYRVQTRVWSCENAPPFDAVVREDAA